MTIRSRTSGRIRAVHYYGNGWPMNLWNSMDRSLVDQDLRTIRSDGFNAIVLVVPWGEFMPGLRPARFDEHSFGELRWLMDRAGLHGLRIVLRLGYMHDFAPEVELPNRARFLAAYHDDVVLDAWKRYVSRVWSVASAFDNFEFAFLTWEDWVSLRKCTAESDCQRRLLGERLHFGAWVSRRLDAAAIERAFGVRPAQLADLPIPAGDDPALEYFFEFWNELLVERVFGPAKALFPRLSFELRVDKDRHVRSDGSYGVFDHMAATRVPLGDDAVIYWAPFLGAANTGDRISASKALLGLVRVLERTRKIVGGRSIFVDQFNFTYANPQFRHNTRVVDEQLPEFLQQAADVLASTRGYALWAWRPYRSSALYNGSFERGLIGWQVEGNVSVERTVEGDHCAVIRGAGFILQTFDRYAFRAAMLDLYSESRLLFRTRSLAGTAGTLSIDLPGPQPHRWVHTLSAEWESVEVRMPSSVLTDLPALRFSTTSEAAAVDRVELVGHTQDMGIYHEDGTPGVLHDAIVRMNSRIARTWGDDVSGQTR